MERSMKSCCGGFPGRLTGVLTAAVVAVGLAALVAGGLSCGGGGDGGGGMSSGVSSGVVTGFGSFFVNGIEFELDGSVNDGENSEDDLEVGFVVRVEGFFSNSGKTGIATSVTFDDVFDGPITSGGVGQVEVVGQAVAVDDSTVVEGVPSVGGVADFTGTEGRVAEVFGFFDGDGNLQATRVEVKGPFVAGVDDIELKGTVSGPVTATTFRVGNLTVDFSGAVLDDLSPGGIVEGLFVEVKSTRDLVVIGGETFLFASEVEPDEPGLPGAAPGQLMEIEGIINTQPVTQGDGSIEFEVAGHPVRVTGATRFENGTAADLAMNVKVEVEGVVGADGVLAAREVSFRMANNVRIEAIVDAVGGQSITALGIEVLVNSLTQVEDKSDEDLRPFSHTGIQPGDRVKLRGFLNAAGQVVGTRVEREDPEDDAEVKLRGPATIVDADHLDILGVMISVIVGTEFENEQEQLIAQDAFFDAVATGLFFVQAQGEVMPGADVMILASELELED